MTVSVLLSPTLALPPRGVPYAMLTISPTFCAGFWGLISKLSWRQPGRLELMLEQLVTRGITGAASVQLSDLHNS